MPFISWTKPTRFAHPRIWATQANLSTLRTRIAGSHSGAWSAIQSWCNSRQNAASYPSSYFFSKDSEWLIALAFSYLMKPTVSTNQAHGARAVAVAMDLANEAIPSGHIRRQYMLSMACIYTWCFDILTDSQRSTLRARIADYVQQLHDPNDTEFLWGTDHGDMVYSSIGAIAILEDGSSADNTTWSGYVDTMLDKWDNGTNSDCYLPVFRYFGDIDGGTNKGSGPASYFERNEEFYVRAMPALQSIGVNWYTSETWWRKSMTWVLWHLRGDRTLHRECEVNCFSSYHINTQIHAYQIASLENNSLGEACQWLASVEIPNFSDSTMWSPYYIHDVLWNDVNRSAVTPTISNQGGTQMKVFDRAGKVCMRAGFAAGDTSFTIEVPRHFTLGHQKSAHGAFELARNKPLFITHGHYDPNQSKTYKQVGSSTITGHRFTYSMNTVCRNVTRIFDTNEPSENAVESFQRQGVSSTRFGVWNGSSVDIKNVGGQLWPKRNSDSAYQAEDLAALLAESEWNFTGFLATPAETDKLCYVGMALTPRYYAQKCTKYNRHVLWIKAGKIPGWNEPVIMIFDDLSTHVDTVGKFTQVFQLQTQKQMTGTAAALQLDNSPDRCFVKTIYPSVEVAHVTGFKDLDGNIYDPTDTDALDDSLVGVWRAELNPASSGGTQQFLTILFPCASTVSAAPSITGINDASWIGATIGGVDCKISKTTTYQASVGVSADTTPPAVPSAPTVSARNNAVQTDWTNPGDSDFDHVELWRRTKN